MLGIKRREFITLLGGMAAGSEGTAVRAGHRGHQRRNPQHYHF